MESALVQLQEKFSEYMPYVDELRRRLYRTVLFFFAVFIVGFFATAPLFKLVKNFFQFKNAMVITTSPFQFLDIAMSTGMFFAIVLTLPVLIYQAYSFLKTCLTKKEKKRLNFAGFAIFILFAVGFAYGFAAMYYSASLMANMNVSFGLQNYWDIGRFISQIFLTSALLGVLFQFPVVITLGVKLGLLNKNFLASKRRYAIAIIFIIVSLLPPTDGLSLVVMAAPLLVLYEATVRLNAKNSEEEIYNNLIINSA